MNKKIVFFSIVFLQLIIIIFLTFRFSNKKNGVLGQSASVVPLKKQDLNFERSSELKYFYEPKPNTKINYQPPSLSYSVTYTINSDGLNERYDYSESKKPDIYRIIALGDSFVYGSLVNTPDSWPEKLEDKLNNELKCKNIKKFEVINLGVPGYDIQYSVERYKRRGQKYNPDLVIWFMRNSDFHEINEITMPLIAAEKEKMQKSGEYETRIRNGENTPDATEALRKFHEEHKIKDLVSYQKKSLEELNHYYYNKLLIISFTDLGILPTKALKEYVQKRQNTYLYREIPVLSDNQIIKNDQHPNPEGHAMISQKVFEYLINNKLINCE